MPAEQSWEALSQEQQDAAFEEALIQDGVFKRTPMACDMHPDEVHVVVSATVRGLLYAHEVIDNLLGFVGQPTSDVLETEELTSLAHTRALLDAALRLAEDENESLVEVIPRWWNERHTKTYDEMLQSDPLWAERDQWRLRPLADA